MNPFIHAILASSEGVIDITQIGETLAYTWFGRPNYAYSEEAQKYWIGSTKDTPLGTTQHILEYSIENDLYTTTQVGTVFEKDDHNQAQILIRKSDNRLIAFYTEHNGLALRWKISTNALDSTSWETEKTLDPLDNYSYISPYQASNGNIFVFFRANSGSNYTWHYIKSIDGGETFGAATQFFDNGATQAYLISCQNGDQVHFTASNGHPQSNSDLNINVYHFYFDLINETVYNSAGTGLTLPVASSDITLVNGTSGNDTSWILDISFKNGFPRILYAIYPDGRVTDFYEKELWFIECDGSTWVNNQKIANTLSGYIEDDASVQEKCYTGASRFDTINPDVVWMPMQVNGVLEIHKVDLISGNIEQLTSDSDANNWRPISLPSSRNNLLWLKNNDYDHYTDYSITLQTKTVQV